MSRVLLDTDIYSEVIKAINPKVTLNAIAYRQANGVLTLTVITVMEIVRGFQQNQSFRWCPRQMEYRMQPPKLKRLAPRRVSHNNFLNSNNLRLSFKLSGAQPSFRRLNDFLTAVASEEVLIFDQPAAELAGRIEGDLVRAGPSAWPTR